MLASIPIAIGSVSSRICHPSITFEVSMVTESQGHHKDEGQRNGSVRRFAEVLLHFFWQAKNGRDSSTSSE